MRDVFGWNRPFTRDVLDGDLLEAAQTAGVIVETTDGKDTVWQSTIRAGTLHDQVFFHSAFPTDAANTVFFGPDTYRFADAVRQAIASRVRPVHRAADIGCGSGAAGILVALAYPDAAVVLSDINDAALALAGVNGKAAGVDNIFCLNSDLFADIDGAFDLIVANPPYLIDQAARVYRHGGGRFGEGLSLRILQEALPRLAPGGTLVLYTGSVIVDGEDFFRNQATAMLAATGWQWRYREVDPDVFGEEIGHGAYIDAERIAAVVLTTERPG